MKRKTSDKILAYLQSHPPASTSELSSALLLTKADIKYHLKNLLRVSIVARQVKRLIPGAGRPGYYYSIVPRNFEWGYPLIVEILFNILFKEAGEDQTALTLERISSTLLDGYGNKDEAGTQRLNSAILHLSGLGYQAAWEARPAHPIVYLKNCPYPDLALRHSEFCNVDTLLIEKLTGWKCNPLLRIRDNVRTIPFCQFSLTAPIIP